jgi:hypothetical protein
MHDETDEKEARDNGGAEPPPKNPLPLRGVSSAFAPQSVLAGLTLNVGDEIVGYAGQDAMGRGASAEIQPDGRIRETTRGLPPSNESNTLFACGILVNAIRATGRKVEDPQPLPNQNDDGDCECLGNGENLRIQVVSAVVDGRPWRDLRLKRRQEVVASSDEFAKQLREAIDKKNRGLGSGSKSKLILALDATRLPALTLSATVKTFRETYGSWSRGCGFREIWLVGPNQGHCHRLDTA